MPQIQGLKKSGICGNFFDSNCLVFLFKNQNIDTSILFIN